MRATGRLAAAARPFRVLGVQQVAIGGTSKAALSKLWVDTLGLSQVRQGKAPLHA